MTSALVLAVAVAIGWLALATLSLVRSKAARRLGPSDSVFGPDSPRIAVIVPARNEAEHIPRTLGCLVGQTYPNLAITVVDDQSTDDTASLAAAQGDLVRLIRGTDRPPGWVGKTWALHQGVRESSEEWLALIDADLWLDPRAIATAMGEAERTGADLVSLLGMPRCRTFWQRTIGLAIVHILASLYPLGRVNDPRRADAIAHGAFILVRRAALEAAGGLEEVKSEIVEDIKLARNVKVSGGRVLARPAPALVQTHMYGSFADIWRGLRKNAYAGMDYAPHKFVTGALITLLFAWTPVVALAAGLAGAGWPLLAAGATGWASMALAAWPAAAFLGLPLGWGLSLPIGLSAYVAITAASAWHYHRGRVLWKDRAFAAPRPTPDRGP